MIALNLNRYRMTELIYEHPLNEKVRTYLRVEHLFNQLQQLLALENEWQQQAYFNTLFDLIEILDRNDIRPDLIKDVERCETALVAWSSHPSVSDDKLQVMLQQAVKLQSDLLRSTKFIASLKQDKFLSPLRQRFSIPGGACYFDIPQLQYWIHLDIDYRQQMANEWYQQLSLVQQAIDFVLSFIRERGHFEPIMADNGFYQSNTDKYELLRLSYPIDAGVYPTVSGNKYRYAIRFMQLCDETGRNNSTDSQQFKLACC